MSCKIDKPWGNYEVLHEGAGYKVKMIRVDAGERLSPQLHKMRSEFWHILSGSGAMKVGPAEWDVERGDTVKIGELEVHRVSNMSDQPLLILELQVGVCDEDDILRLEDDYGRGQE